MLSIPGSIPADYTIVGTDGTATGGQGYRMELVTQVSITWLSLKWLADALVLEAEWSRIWEIPLVLTTWNCGIAQGSGGTRPRILLTTL